MNNSEQIDFAGKIESATISMDEAALRLGVSTATIRNWLKTGYLKSAGNGGITQDSVARFQVEIAGREKLNQRANKSLKDSHDHVSKASIFLDRSQSENTDAGNLGEDYESSLSDSYRNKEGIYYTPPEVVRDLFSAPQEDVRYATFCDPCCGSGNFIIRALELGFKPENIYGYDVDPVAVEITKSRIYQFCGYESANIQQGDFLNIVHQDSSRHFDFIYTNPPWGKKIPKEERNQLGARFGSGASVDTCSLFFFACLECLNCQGELGLLLPESFFNISTFEAARIRALSLSVERLVDYGRAFKGLLTKAQAIVLRNTPAVPYQLVKCENSKHCVERSIQSFASNPKSILNLYCDQYASETLERIFSIPHITLARRAMWGLGIVTGNNKRFIRNHPEDGFIPVFKGSDISQTSLKEPSHYIPADLDLYQQVAPVRIFQSKEKLIYKFISSRLCFFCDTEQRFVLNSANMLIPSKDFPISTQVLGELLSSDFMNWVFTNIFHTHKILRGDLESLPIHSQFLKDISSFDEVAYIEFLHIKRAPDGTYRAKSLA